MVPEGDWFCKDCLGEGKESTTKKLATEKAKMKLLESDAEDKDDKDKGK